MKYPASVMTDATITFPISFTAGNYDASRSNMVKMIDTYSSHQHIVSRQKNSLTFPGLTQAYCTVQTFFMKGY